MIPDLIQLQRMNDGLLSPPEVVTLIDQMAQIVAADPRYRVARELIARDDFNAPSGAAVARALIVDVEATGLDRGNDRIIELGMLAFEYEPQTSRILRVIEVLDELEDPGCPIPQAATAVHGIQDEMVRGKRIDDAQVARIAQDATMVIAHNADYDRAMLERRFTCFTDLHWACSAREIPWRERGFASNALGHLALASGFFFGAHRAVMDCRALLEVLARPFPSGEPASQPLPAFAFLLQSVVRRDHRLWALQAPFERKDLLKARGYRWHNGDDGQPKSWTLSFPAESTRLEAELDWLGATIYKAPARLRLDTIDARTRYTDRNAVSQSIQLSR